MATIPLLDTPEERLKIELFLKPLSTREDLGNWTYTFLGVTLPFGVIDDDSTGAPGDAIWEGYVAYRDDLYIDKPGFIWVANRDGGKTISGSILNVLLLVHFKATIAHLAAVKKQAEKCLEYTNTFVRKVTPYLEAHKRKVVSDSKSKIQILNEDNSLSYIDVVVANLAGGNSQRSTVGSYDELDTLSKQGFKGYEESKLIPTRMGGHGPLSIKYSTRKFAFGVFANEILNAKESGETIVQWNLIDMTEYCPTSRNKKDTGNVHIKYARKRLPMKYFTEEEVEEMPPLEKGDFKPIQLYDGCLTCPLAAVCKSKLAHRKETDVPTRGIGLLKTIDFTIRQFKKISLEMAEAQLLCWRPSTSGLVYPRFIDTHNGNVATVAQAYHTVTGETNKNVTFEDLLVAIKKCEARIYAGLDWGFVHDSVIVIMAVLPTGDSLILDNFASPGLETHEFADIAMTYQERYGVKDWFCDQASPAAIKTFKKKGMKCPDFKKDVMDGIDAIRSQLLTTTGARKLKVVDTEENKPMIEMFKKHHFLLDNAGKVTATPDDGELADRADATRYIGQNIFSKTSRRPIVTSAQPAPTREVLQKSYVETNKHIMQNKVTELVNTEEQGKTHKKGSFHWNF